jgi:four helix bundle protein
VQDYRKLKVWEKAHELTVEVYRLTSSFPEHETYGLASQMQRSSSSVPTNIAEGCGLSSTRELLKHLHYSMGSAKELEYQLLLSRDLDYISNDHYERLTTDGEVQRMLSALIRTLKRGLAD